MKCLSALALLPTLLLAELALWPRPGAEHPFTEESPWTPMGLNVSYFNLGWSNGAVDFWFDARFQNIDSLIRLRGPCLDRLERVPPQFDTRLVRGYDLDLNGIPHPILSRSSGVVLQDGTALVLGSIGPRYEGGNSELVPVLFLQPPGGTWRYLGPPSGDPADFLAAARAAGATVRCEGAGIVQLPDGRLRLYAHGMLDAGDVPARVRNRRLAVNTLLIAEADTPEGPWRFLRDAEVRPLDLFRDSPLPWLFAHVQPLGEHGFMLTGGDAWPPQAVYAAYSADGLSFHLPARADGTPLPLQRATDVAEDARFCKALRGVLVPDSLRFLRVMNISRPEHRGQSFLYSGEALLNPEALRELLGEDGAGRLTR